jgi:hemerythrin
VKRKIAAEHRELDLLIAEVGALLSRADGAAAGALEELRLALEAHFGREEGPYYPAIWSLRPERKLPLIGFIRAHEHFRARMVEIAALLEAGSPAEAGRVLDSFEEEFARHEREEEELLRSLDQELADYHA